MPVVVLDAWKAFATHDPARITPLFAPDAEWHELLLRFELRDGLIDRVREYLDTRRDLEMFGL